MRIFIINGRSESGKDTFVEYVTDAATKAQKSVTKVSAVEPLVELYRLFFAWDGNKAEKHRNNLNILKRMWDDCSEGSSKYILSRVVLAEKFHTDMVFIFMRSWDEIEEMKKAMINTYGNCSTIELDRPHTVCALEVDLARTCPDRNLYDWRITVETDHNWRKNLQCIANAFVDSIYKSTEHPCEKYLMAWNAEIRKFTLQDRETFNGFNGEKV